MSDDDPRPVAVSLSLRLGSSGEALPRPPSRDYAQPGRAQRWVDWLVAHDDAITAITPDFARTDWEWGRESWGHHGATLEPGGVLWYTHSHNPHGSNGAASQTTADFLQRGQSNGPTMPDEMLVELFVMMTRRG